ncbi:hypothetical protein GE09DRAFT_1237695 [Coniochaeta sp. 2T2.1]|nr:hypothetical protein GE09DRAFT_1237695 [Coniochaeta sp. 2T2.1]
MKSSTPNSKSILTVAESLLDSACHFTLRTETAPFAGGEYIIYSLESESKARSICLRIPRAATNPHVGFLVAQEAGIRRRIDAAGIPLFQPLLSADPTADNILKTPYLALGWAAGKPLIWNDTSPACQSDRQTVLHAVANVSLDLLQIQELGETALNWITCKINRKIVRAKANTLPGGTVAECEDQKNLVAEYWIPELDAAPHVLVHGDLSGNNIIVADDDTFAVKSIIDLGWAELVPFQFAAVYPRFLTHEPDGGGALGFASRDTKQMREDRTFYLKCILARATREGGIALDYYRVLGREDEPSRYWWFTAASQIGIHKAMVSCGWAPFNTTKNQK